MVAPMEPMQEVYYALAELNDSVPADQLCLQLTTTGSIWQGKQSAGEADAAALQEILDSKNTQAYYSEHYACAYLRQTGMTPVRIVWYLNEQAVRERVQLCGLFGVEQLCLGDMEAVPERILAGIKK